MGRVRWIVLGLALPQTLLAYSAGLIHLRVLSRRVRESTNRATCMPSLMTGAEVTGRKLDRKQLTSEFSTWLVDRGCRGIGSVVSVRESSTVGGWGLFAEKDIEKGDAVLALPLSTLSLSEESAERLADFGQVFDEISDALQELYGFSNETPHGCPFIAVQLLLHLQQGGASDWAPYMDMLPRDRCAGWRWSASGLPAALEQDAAAIRESIRHEFNHLEQHVFDDHRNVFSAEFFTLEHYFWAKELVLSRAYAVEGDLGGLVCLLPGIDMANHASDVEYGVRQLSLDEARRVPWDGAFQELTTQEQDEDEEMVALVADRKYERGEEVWSSYGPLDKSRLALFFGFVAVSAADSLNFDLEIPDDDEARLKLLAAHGLSSTSRLEIVHSATDFSDGGKESQQRAFVLAPPQEVLNFASVCALPADDVLRAAAAVGNGAGQETGEVMVGHEPVGRSALLLLRHAIAAAAAQVGDDAATSGSSHANGTGERVEALAWQRDAARQIVAGRQAVGAAACRWIDQRLGKDAADAST